MSNINYIYKWNLQENKWDKCIDLGRSLALCNYDNIINSRDEDINYIILASGMRVENCSKDFKNINNKQMGVDKIISYFGKKNGNYIIKSVMLDTDAPLIEESKLLAKYIDDLCSLSNTASVNLIGISKCGTMNCYIPRFMSNSNSFNKTNIYSVASPYEGTILASPNILNLNVKNKLISRLGNNSLSDYICSKFMSCYEIISSNSHMDYDIALQNGVSEDKRNCYDESFIKNIFSNDNIKYIKKINYFYNFVTGIDNETLMEALLQRNINGILLCFMNNLIFNEQSDGMVLSKSQYLIENYISIRSIVLKSSHHDVTSNPRILENILYVVNETIEEQNSKKSYRRILK